MDESPKPMLIGVDGGGTSCRIALLRDGRRTEVKVGSANVSTDPEAAVGMILRGIAEVAAQRVLGESNLSDCDAYLGLAGVVGPRESDFVRSRLPFRRALVEDDRPAALVGALGPDDGTLAGVGTGSFLARRKEGHISLFGGWGLALGDEASGGWLGRGLLTRVLHTVDGLRNPSPLTRAILDEMGGAAGIVRFSLTARPGDYARLAPRVIQAAEAEDAVAAGLMYDGAAYLADGLAAIGWREGEPLCLIGGIAPHYTPYLGETVVRSVRPPRGNALDGALALAATLGEREGSAS